MGEDRAHHSYRGPAHIQRARESRGAGAHLQSYRGILQADAYAGYNGLFRQDRQPEPLKRALCWGHARRHFFELADAASQLKKRRKGSR
ncbi:transposase [Novosphingobium sp. 9U]|uniref:IS66 family transposase n=1 Tax=Novosphingobium sp. 9U TaxID=2653158 RepID=UPI0013571BFE